MSTPSQQFQIQLGLSGEAPSRPLLALAMAGAVALAAAMGIGRFAFTPLLPMMLHDGQIDLQAGSWLATSNYVGYLLGALGCMFMPKVLTGATAIRLGLVATALLTLAMALPFAFLWPVLRFLAGVASAVVFVYTSGWCLAHAAHRRKPEVGALIYTGPGAGIAVSGLAATAMVALHLSAEIGWLVFGALAAIMAATVWHILSGPDAPAPALATPASDDVKTMPRTGSAVEMAVFALAYGIAGFGYIVTATFLPVIARSAVPGSVWLDLFWPILGVGVLVGALVAARVPASKDPRLLLATCYIIQAAGVVMGLVLPSVPGFVLGSFMVGLPFTAISYFGMKDVRRLRPHHIARFMGLLTAAYGLGQIIGPPMVAMLLNAHADKATGFTHSLEIASLTLVAGAGLYLVMWLRWPLR